MSKEVRKAFAFSKENNVEVLDLDTLKRTYREVDSIRQEPLKGIFHFQLIEKIMSLAEANKLNYNVKEIFAADNRDRNQPGVTIAPHMEKEYGEKAVEAHCLRRVFTTLEISDMEDEETNTGLAISFHQEGIQIAIGPRVKICHNQCILSAERYIANYGGDNKIKDFDKMFAVVDDWMKNFSGHREQDMNVLSKMKQVPLDYRQTAELIGHLMYQRVGADTGLIKRAKYPLNNTQINEFTESYLREYGKRLTEGKDTTMSLYEIYNMATALYKADRMNIPSIMSQNLAWTEILIDKFAL